MDRIRPWLYIGKYRDTLNLHLLSMHNVKAMLQLAELVEHPGITSLYLDVEDGEPLSRDLLRTGVEFVITEKERGHNVLISCGAGISRSAAFTIAVLKEVEEISLLDAFLAVKKKHPQTLPHPTVWESVCKYYGEDDIYQIYLPRYRDNSSYDGQ